jgi:hypothetical protein
MLQQVTESNAVVTPSSDPPRISNVEVPRDPYHSGFANNFKFKVGILAAPPSGQESI